LPKFKGNFTCGRNFCQLRRFIQLLTDSYENELLHERHEVLLNSVRFRKHITYPFKSQWQVCVTPTLILQISALCPAVFIVILTANSNYFRKDHQPTGVLMDCNLLIVKYIRKFKCYLDDFAGLGNRN
jgi:hypothetical protein